MKSVDSMQLGLFFHIGVAMPAPGKTAEAEDEENEASYAIHQKAFSLIQAGVCGVPSWQIRLDNNGFPTEDANAGWYSRAELCEHSGDTEQVNGRPAYSLWFHADGTFPLDLAQDLKAFCLAKYVEAASGEPVQFVKAERHTRWSDSETVTWPEVEEAAP